MNDQRPTCWPCSADSSKKPGPSPRSFKNAATGLSQSSMKLCVTGTRLWSPVSASVSSSVGRTSRFSATAANEHLLGVLEREPARPQQDREVVEDVRGLLGHALVGLLPRRPRDLLGLLLDLLADEGRVGQELARVAARVGHALLDRALQPGQRLVGQRVRVAGEEAGALARVAGGAVGLHEREHGVVVAVEAQRLDGLRVAGRRALVPQLLARAAVEVQLAGAPRERERLGVHVREGQDLAGAPILDDARNEAALIEAQVWTGGLHFGAESLGGGLCPRRAT